MSLIFFEAYCTTYHKYVTNESVCVNELLNIPIHNKSHKKRLQHVIIQ